MDHEHDHEAPVMFHRDVSRLNRRHAMSLMAASLALATGACSRQPAERIHPWVQMPEALGEGSIVYFASAVVRDGHAQGVLIGTQQGRPMKIEGNPLHPSSLGATDVFAQASMLDLWDPDRSSAVMQRLGGASESRAQSGPLAVSSWTAFETAWRQVARPLDARRGEGLRILTGPVSSPTLRAQITKLLQRYPRARWHQYSPLNDEAARDGAIAAFGKPVQSVLHLDRARCIVALGGDPFSDGPGAVRYAADWARRRRASQPTTTYAVEIAPGLFGARADRRIALAPARIDALVARLAARILGTSNAAPADDATAAFESSIVAALQSAGGESLIVAGPHLSPASHARIHAIQQRLGAVGRTIDFIAPLAVAQEAATLEPLVRDMRVGAVDTLFILDANPAYDAPGALGFAAALANVRMSVHCGLYRDETSHACGWHLPMSHACEQWSDALAHDGTACIVQPAIAPLYDTRSPHELIALLSDDTERDGFAIVQRQWRAHAGAEFDAFWRESLRTGDIAGTAAQPLQLPEARAANLPAPSASDGLAIVFAADPSTHDGRFANNGWLQELPRPFTKLTWDNVVLMGPATAREANVKTGDVVRVSVGERHIDGPAWVQSQHAEGAITLPLGYGRSRAGRIGSGVGFDAYPLMPLDANVDSARVQALGRRYPFAVTQHSLDPSGREPARTIAAGERVEPQAEHASLYPERSYPDHAWAMTIDLDSCIGCNACTIACQAENNIPIVGKEEVIAGREMHWIRVDRYESAQLANSIFQPVPCMHCENAPCELVCPVGATMHDSEGLNVQVYNRCIGTRFCSNNCPYKVRRFNFLQYTDETHESLKGQRNPNVTVRQRGVMEKCTYCLQRVARARQHSQRTGVPLVDGDVVTACQSVCPTTAIHFGDLNDPRSAVVQMRKSPRHYALLGELNTKPRTTYLARVKPEDKA